MGWNNLECCLRIIDTYHQCLNSVFWLKEVIIDHNSIIFLLQSDDSDIWDDTALIKAYDKAVASFKVKLIVMFGYMDNSGLVVKVRKVVSSNPPGPTEVQ